jgi:pilus assembly protein CpaF
MSSPRQSGSALRPPPRPTGVGYTMSGYEVVKVRLLIKLDERLAALKGRRMPASLFAEAARQQAEQLVESEGARLNPADRARLAREVAEEAFGFGPLEELFVDPAVLEITVLGSQAVLVRRGTVWLPSHVRLRDEEHLVEVLAKVRSQGEAVAPGLPESVLDVRLGNGFRAVALVPPAAAGAPPMATFVRSEVTAADSHPAVVTAPAGGSGTFAMPPSGAMRAAGSSGAFPAIRPAADQTPRPLGSVTDRHRQRITERFIAKLAALGVFDLSGIETGELRKVIEAYVEEYCKAERIYLTDTDKGRVTLEILTGMGR